jgi:predicted metal-dependent hydrolase
MIHVLTIGNTKIPYAVRFSARARRKRIVVTPEGVEVIAPAGTPLEGRDSINTFLQTKRRWLYDAVRDVAARQGKLLTQYYASGAKLQYRGRWLMIDVQPGPVDAVDITCKSKLHVTVPETMKNADRLAAVKEAFDTWLKERAERDLQHFARHHGDKLNVALRGAKITESRHAWGTCGKDRIIRVHWRLIQAPRVAMEYVVAHELAHLIHRNHGPRFWKALGETMPNWAEGKAHLERWEGEHRAV